MNQTGLSLLLVFLLSGALTAIYGQDFRAKVQGRVTDTSEAVVPGATVTLFNVNTGVRTAKSTNEVGLYRFDYVDPGSYTVIIETSGFSRFVQENVAIRAQADITVDAVLKPGGVQETVTVDASPAAVEFNSTS
jgi:type 1 fimbria pilin